MLKRIFLLCTALMLILTSGCDTAKNNGLSREQKTLPNVENKLKFSVLKIGKADAIILQTKNSIVMIDCGEEDDGDEITENLRNMGVDTIDYVFITHFDKDHVGGAAQIIKGFSVEQVITPDYVGNNEEYKKFIQAVNNSITPTRLKEKMNVILDDVLFTVYPPQKKNYSEPDNDYSLAISVEHGNNRLLFAGDAEEERIAEIISEITGEYDFIKMPHHGRYNKNIPTLIRSTKPKYAIITDSKKNPAEEETVELLKKENCMVYCTKDGDVSGESDGKSILISQ